MAIKRQYDNYKFDPDFDIGQGHSSSDELNEEAMKIACEDEVAHFIPPEYRDKIIYTCKLKSSSDFLAVPYVCGWLYPGKQLKQKRTA